MGFFNKIFNSSDDSSTEDATPWIALDKIDQLDDILEKSENVIQLIFKHSTRCGISRMVINQFKKDYPLSEKEADLYYLDLLKFRDVSDAVANKFQVMHESPQLIILNNGKVIIHKSHGSINNLNLKEYV